MSKKPHELDLDKRAVDTAWYNDLHIPDNTEYHKMLPFAAQQYDERMGIFDMLDKKAEWLFGISLAFSALLFTAITEQGSQMKMSDYVPVFILLVISMERSLRSRSPILRHKPMSIKGMLDVAANGHDRFSARMAASFFCACGGVQTANEWKSAHLQLAARILIVTIILAIVTYLLCSTNV